MDQSHNRPIHVVPLAFDAPSAEDDGDPTDTTDLCAWAYQVKARLLPI